MLTPPGRWAAVVVFATVLAACTSTKLPNPGCATRCPEGLVCDEANGVCVPAAAQPALRCESDEDCNGSSPHCDADSGQCVQCTAGNQCESGACQSGLCLPVPDRCDVAQTIEVTEAVTRLEANTAGREDDTRALCGLGEGAPDLVYALHLSSPARLTVRVTPLGSSALRPVLELRSSCVAGSSSDVLGCQWAGGDGSARLSADVAAGTWYLWVDADFGTAGAFALEVSAPPSTEGDSCLAANTLLPVGSTVELDGDTRGLADDYAGYCGGGGAPDAVYNVVLQHKQRLRVTAAPTSSGYYPVIYLRRPQQCATPNATAQLDCGAGYQDPAVLDIPALEPGTYSLFVDGAIDSGFVPTAGSYHLKIEQLPSLPLATNDRCEGAEPLVLPQSGSVSVSGDTFQALADATSACGGSGPDLVYSFTLTEPRYLTARVVPDGSTPFAPVVYIRTTCDGEGAEQLVACNSAPQVGASATVQHGNLPAGSYFLWVDGRSQTRGRFTLKVDVAPPLPPPGNDSCQNPEPLSPSNGISAVTGTTLGANDDASSCTVPEGGPSPDVVYALDVPVQSSVSFDVEAPQGSTLRPLITLERGTCGGGEPDRMFCAWGDPFAPSRVVHTLGSVAPGRYSLWIDGDYTSSGPFTLKARLGPPVSAPSNDGCTTALAINGALGSVTGDTRSASDSTSGYCQPWEAGSGEGAGDVAFSFELQTTRTVNLTVTPDPWDGTLFRPVVYVRGPTGADCGSLDSTAQLGCGAAPSLGAPATLSLPNLAPGTYTVWVDGVGLTSGKFSLSIQ